ncbi:PGN_0703 family putative restriction endonuclease [Arthrobacter sp. TE12232]
MTLAPALHLRSPKTKDDVRSVIGPLPQSDSGLLKRIRFHQAWYRWAVLGLPDYGSLAGSGAGCGSVLADPDAEAFKNFVSSRALLEYQGRRLQGWGVDPVRCTKYMTSSQTLTFNMLADAVARPVECANLFGILTGREDLDLLADYHFEYSAVGKPHFLGDRTLLDVLLEFRTTGGGTQVVAVETKLADRFSTRKTTAMHGSLYLAIQEESGLWHSLEDALKDNQTRQLARCHALAQSVQRTHRRNVQAIVLTLLHDSDQNGVRATTAYARCAAIDGTARTATWGEYLDTAGSVNAVSSETLSSLRERYVNLSASQSWWDLCGQKPHPRSS